MIDPISAFAAAQSAFTLTKKLIGAGRELHDVSKSLGSWYEACADINRAETQRKNPTWLDKRTHGSDTIEQQAMDIVIRKKTLKENEVKIKFMLDYRFGLGTYDEMLVMRRKLREERERTVYRQMEAKRQIQNNAAIGTLGFLIFGTLGGCVPYRSGRRMKPLLVSMYLAGLLTPETVTCHLWKRLEINEVKHCIYRGPNRTVYTHFPTHRWNECPKQFQCPYSSMKDKKPTVHEMLKGLREGFGN